MIRLFFVQQKATEVLIKAKNSRLLSTSQKPTQRGAKGRQGEDTDGLVSKYQNVISGFFLNENNTKFKAYNEMISLGN